MIQSTVNSQLWPTYIAQWKFSCQKGMKKNIWAKAGLEPGTAEFPQRHELTIEPHS